MISLSELNPKNFPLTPEMQANQAILLERINVVRSSWGKPMQVTSGVRSLDDLKRIYREIAQKKGLSIVRVPMGSKHLTGQAVDISDPDGSLMQWCLSNVALLEQAQLWCEAGTVGWVHFQCVAPGSGNRFFKP